MNNLSSYCWLVDAKMRASDKDLPVLLSHELGDICEKYLVKDRFEQPKKAIF